MDFGFLKNIIVSINGMDEYKLVASELRDIGFKWANGEDLVEFNPLSYENEHMYLYFNHISSYPNVITYGRSTPGTAYKVIQKDELFNRLLVGEPICIDEINIREVLI